MKLFKRAKEILEYKKTKATLTRADYPGQTDFIKVILPSGAERYLFANLVAHVAKGLSPNERKKVIADCEKQIDNLKDGNCPTVFREMLRELKYGCLRTNNR